MRFILTYNDKSGFTQDNPVSSGGSLPMETVYSEMISNYRWREWESGAVEPGPWSGEAEKITLNTNPENGMVYGIVSRDYGEGVLYPFAHNYSFTGVAVSGGSAYLMENDIWANVISPLTPIGTYTAETEEQDYTWKVSGITYQGNEGVISAGTRYEEWYPSPDDPSTYFLALSEDYFNFLSPGDWSYMVYVAPASGVSTHVSEGFYREELEGNTNEVYYPAFTYEPVSGDVYQVTTMPLWFNDEEMAACGMTMYVTEGEYIGFVKEYDDQSGILTCTPKRFWTEGETGFTSNGSGDRASAGDSGIRVIYQIFYTSEDTLKEHPYYTVVHLDRNEGANGDVFYGNAYPYISDDLTNIFYGDMDGFIAKLDIPRSTPKEAVTKVAPGFAHAKDPDSVYYNDLSGGGGNRHDREWDIPDFPSPSAD